MIINEIEIENIIFDLGGVILDIDIIGVIEKFKQIGIGPFENKFGIINGNSIFKEYEVGKISTFEFRNELRKFSKSEFSDEQFDQIWNSIILNFPKENISIVEKLKTEYKTFLMSNTNALHCDYFNNLLGKQSNYHNLDQLFEKVYYSHDLGMRKPEPCFYELILIENNLNPKSTLFVDDFQENIEAAAALGLQTIHIKEGTKLKDFIKID